MGIKTLLKFKLNKQGNQSSQQKEELLSEEEISELWQQCPSCKSMLYKDDLKQNLQVCPKCEHHFRISAYERIEQLLDPDTWEESGHSVKTSDPLEFVDLKPYHERIISARNTAEASEAIITGTGKIKGQGVALAAMEFKFLGGSMGSVVGERIARLSEIAIEQKLPLIIVSSSGGARMHEGLCSLLQMAKTSASLAKLREAKLLFISLLADPTYGGVSASFSMLGDLIIAEPKAKIGFAGPRVIEETIRQKLPKSFQRAEYLLEHGQVDMVIHRHQLQEQIATLIRLHQIRH